jgi:xylan 1,4-beta-xylosidase
MSVMRIACVMLAAALAAAQTPATIRVNASARLGPYLPLWAYFGYDEPNYTYAENGRKLIGELGALDSAPVQIRTHNLLTTGDGTPGLKWGSTNAYTEDASGRPIYDWSIVDRIFDTYLRAKARPFVEIGFMPQALSSHPEPYRHHWPETGIAAGWAYPPKDYEKWAALVEAWVRHCAARYGENEISSWYWEVWNEPDIEYWQGTAEEYDKLYDVTARAVKRAAPRARVGGPAVTGPAGTSGGAFLRQFLEHCARSGAPLDFISYHAKGRPVVVDGHARMGLANELEDAAAGAAILAGFPEYSRKPVILSEADPEGCAACSSRTHPQNRYRNGTLYPCYTAAVLGNLFKMADRDRLDLQGMLTWAFEFEDQPYFAGFRTLATNGIDKPVLNVFRMAARMHGQRVALVSTGALGLDRILKSGVRGEPDIDGLAVRSERGVSVLVWNYHDDDVAGPDAAVHLVVSGLPSRARQVRVRHWRIDGRHSNSYTAWQAMGSPEHPSAAQYARLESAGKLQPLEAPRMIRARAGTAKLRFALPRHAVSLVELSW